MNNNYVLGISDEGFHHIAYSEWGESHPALADVVCVHGYTRNAHDFDALASYLSTNGRHVFCPDVAGRGESSWFKKSHHYNFTQYIHDMTALIARVNTEQIDWIGTSMGGIIGMMMAALPNTPIRRLILNDVGPQIPLFGLKRIAKSTGKCLEFKSVNEAKEYYKLNYTEFGNLSDEQWDTFTANSIRKKAPGVFISKADPAIKNPKSISQIITEFFHHPHKVLEGILYDIDLWSIWQQIKCPVLVIHGVHSELLTSAIIKRMVRTHQGTQVYEVHNAGHAPALLDLVDHETIETWLNL